MADESRLPLSGWTRRASAALIDLVIVVITWFVFMMIYFLIVNLFGMQADPAVETRIAFTINLIFFLLLLPFFWGGVSVGIFGQTPGKAALKLKVVLAADHRQIIGFWKGIGRETVRVGPFLTFCLILFVIAHQFVIDYSVILNQETVEGFILVPLPDFYIYALNLWWLVPLWGLVDHLWQLVSRHNQALHDKAVRSQVVIAKRVDPNEPQRHNG